MIYRAAIWALVLGFPLLAFPAQAQEVALDTPQLEVDLTVGVVSDYRYRGVSLSDKDPALQGQLTLSHQSGAYLSGWASTIAENDGEDIETQLTAGYSTQIAGLSVDVYGAYYLYPGARTDNYAEVAVRLGHAFGPVAIGALASYAPAQDNIGGEDNVYFAVDGSVKVPGTPLSLTGSLGLEDGAFADHKWDWSVGVRGGVAGFDCSLTYVDAARAFDDPNADPTVVLSLSKTF